MIRCFYLTFDRMSTKESPIFKKRRIKLADEVFYMASIGNHILTLTDITGEYDACFGELRQGKAIVLKRLSIEFK